MIYPIVFFELCLIVSTLVIMIICGMYYGGISTEFVLRQFPAAAILINILFTAFLFLFSGELTKGITCGLVKGTTAGAWER